MNNMDDEIKKLNDKIDKLDLKVNKKEDDLKNIINEKDIIINEIQNKILEQENIIKENKNEIISLNKKIEDLLNQFNVLKNNLENKINNEIIKIKNEFENKLKEKESTINNLRNDLNNKSNQSEEKINIIKKNITACKFMDKSNIFNFEDMCLISSGIKKNLNKNIKNYNLIFKASKDGYKGEDFHKKCDGVSNTLIIILTKNGRRFGGFTDLTWDNGTNYSSKRGGNSFIFSLDYQEIYFKKNGAYGEIYCFYLYGPVFNDFRYYVYDIELNGYKNEEKEYYDSYNIYTSKFYSYNNKYFLTGEKNFSVNDYEVYAINFE